MIFKKPIDKPISSVLYLINSVQLALNKERREVEMHDEVTFGTFIRKKRLSAEPHISLRKFAEMLDISPVYMSNIETDRNAAPKEDILANIARILELDKQEQELMYELAAKTKTYTAVPEDLPEYISSNEYARIALRVAKDVDATDKEWIEFIEKLKKRSRKDGRKNV
jgi:transcriptional regulator with XRE-family HTH domain